MLCPSKTNRKVIMVLRKIISFVFISFSFVRNHDLASSQKYIVSLPRSVLNLSLEVYDIYLSNDEVGILKKETITRNRRESDSAAPVIKKFDHQFEEERKDMGQSAVIKCEPKGTGTSNITWYKDDATPVKRTDRGGVLPVTYDIWSIFLNDLVPEDSGNYTCRICNQVGCAEHVHRLVITGYPKLFPTIRKGYPGNTTVLISDSVILSCSTVNLTDYSVKWAKLIGGFQNNATQDLMTEEGKYAVSDNTLTIYNATKKDEGWYMCITNNTIGTDRATGYLKVAVSGRVPSNGGPENKGYTISRWLTGVLSTLLIVSFVVVAVVLFKFRRERIMKRHAVDTAREVMFEQWMKVVSIEREKSNGYTPEGTLLMPRIRIEKQRFSDIVDRFPDYVFLNDSEYMLPPDNKWEIDRQNLTLGKVLGEGEFGKVVEAKYRKASQRNALTVAVKMLKEGHSDADMISFVSEVEIMKMIGKHENIINLLGCCTKGGPLYVVVEFAANGCLRDYLKDHRPNRDSDCQTEDQLPLKNQELVQFSLQVARGMEYLASRGCIHRDLAARNVLVSRTRVLKVADFGLARDVRDSDYYRKRTAGKLPIRWMAPESLCHNYYTTKSDVWSFGVLTWEIMTYGETPYSKIPMHFLYNYLRQGKRMERPTNCSEDMYHLIKHCCSFNPDDRPTFSDLKEKLEIIYNNIEQKSSLVTL